MKMEYRKGIYCLGRVIEIINRMLAGEKLTPLEHDDIRAITLYWNPEKLRDANRRAG